MASPAPARRSAWGRPRELPWHEVAGVSELEPAVGFEPTTYGLQNRCTTTVLHRPRKGETEGLDITPGQKRNEKFGRGRLLEGAQGPIRYP